MEPYVTTELIIVAQIVASIDFLSAPSERFNGPGHGTIKVFMP